MQFTDNLEVDIAQLAIIVQFSDVVQSRRLNMR